MLPQSLIAAGLSGITKPSVSDGGEGTPYTPLVAPTVTQGRITRAPDGTVSTTITVGAASGGSGSYTYSVGSLDKPGGSTALLSAGTAPTTFTLSNMADGESYVVYGTVTDAGDVSQVVTWSHTVVVAEPEVVCPTEPTLSVASRDNGEAYTVTAGARSIAITAQAGATLLTTVEQASTGATIVVTGNATTSPSWTAPSGTTVGEACQVTVTATLDGLTSQVSWTEYTAGSGGGSGSFQPLRSIALTSAANDGPHTSGSHTATDGDGDSIGYAVVQNGSNTGDFELVNGTGGILDGVGSNSVFVSWDIGAVISGESSTITGPGVRYVHVVLASLDLSSDIRVGWQTTDSITGPNFRGVAIVSDGASGVEANTMQNNVDGASTIYSEATVPAALVVTLCLHQGAFVSAKVTTGSSPPADALTGTTSVGSAAVGQEADGAYATTLKLITGAVLAAGCTITDIIVGAYE